MKNFRNNDENYKNFLIKNLELYGKIHSKAIKY